MPGELGYDTGPYVNVAAFCEKVLQEQDGVLSAIRLIDQLNVKAEGPEAPENLPPGIVQANLLIMLKAGQARGTHTVQVVMEAPDGTRKESPQMSVTFNTGPSGGANLIMPIAIKIETAGLYWAAITVNGRMVSRVPLQVNYGFVRPQGQGPS